MGGSGEGLIEILRDCVADGSISALAAIQRLAEHVDGGTYSFELTAPSAYAMCCWGPIGLDAFIEIATRVPSIKNVSLCLQLLAGLAAGRVSARIQGIVGDKSLLSAIGSAMAGDERLQRAARQRLHAFILAMPTDARAVETVGRQLSFLFDDDDLASARELFAALASRWLVVGTPTLTRYEELITTASNDEPSFQRFFEDTPQVLDPMAVSIWARPDLLGAKEPDFVLRRADDTYLVIEIETPAKPLVTLSKQVSAEVTHAVAQATDYRDFLLEHLDAARRQFPNFRDPDCLVVVGLERELTPEQSAVLARANSSYRVLRVVGFDWIGRRAKTITNNILESRSVEPRARVL